MIPVWHHEDRKTSVLLGQLAVAHQKAAAQNLNASSVSVQLAAEIGQPFPIAVAYALLTLGDRHGPITEAREWIYERSKNDFIREIEEHRPIAGWGNSFHKDQVDPAWTGLSSLLEELAPEHHARLVERSGWIEERKGQKLHPNAAAYTACVAEIASIPWGTEAELFIGMRLPVWARIYRQARDGR